VNMIVDPEDWAAIGQINKDVWRVAYGEPGHLTEKEILERQHAKYERLLPGPRPLKYELVSCSPFWAHQRTATHYREGRVILCGDSAHVCSPRMTLTMQANNPLGGLGLTTGLLDAATLGNCLIRMLVKGESDILLTRYADSRRKAWVDVTNAESAAFKYRLSSTDPKHVAERERYFNALNNDPDIHRRIANSMNEVLQDLSAD
jgi:2-polyprenyl-6-methoxyphenol hydroxylase-like FAD-dependent oxidoreductase